MSKGRYGLEPNIETEKWVMVKPSIFVFFALGWLLFWILTVLFAFIYIKYITAGV